MTHNSLDTFVAHITDAWGPLTPDLVTRSQGYLQDLLATPVTEPWLDRLHADAPALLLRFADRDLKKEDKEEHRVKRYAARDGLWTVPAA